MPKRHRRSRKHATNPDLLARLEAALSLPAGTDAAGRGARIEAAAAMLREVAPADGTEAMLACQMVATHEAAMECLRRSSSPDGTDELRDRNLKHAERLLALYARQMEVLGRYRLREQKLADMHEKAAGRKPQLVVIKRIIVDPRAGTETESPLTRPKATAAAPPAPESPPPDKASVIRPARANGQRSDAGPGGW